MRNTRCIADSSQTYNRVWMPFRVQTKQQGIRVTIKLADRTVEQKIHPKLENSEQKP